MRPILLKGHERSITCVKYNMDGDLLFTAVSASPKSSKGSPLPVSSCSWSLGTFSRPLSANM